MRYSTPNINAKLSATIMMMIVLILVNTNAIARPNFKMKTKQVETTTHIAFKVPHDTKVWMNVYDLEGRYVAELMNEKRVKKGKLQSIEVNTTNWREGEYTVEVRTTSGEVWVEVLVISR